MKKYWPAFLLFTIFTIFFGTLWAIAQDAAPADPQAALGMIAQVFILIKGGNAVMGAGGLVLILVWAFRAFAMPKINMSSAWLPWISLGLGALVGIASSVLGGMDPKQAAEIALLSGPVASKFWSSVVKNFLPA